MESFKKFVSIRCSIASTNFVKSITILENARRKNVKDYLKKAHELKNKLKSIGETTSDKQVNQMIFNGLLRSYESTIQMLSYLNATMTFDSTFC